MSGGDELSHDRTGHAFREVLDECKGIFLSKNQDYGTAWHHLRLLSLADKILIKAKRIRRLNELGANHKIAEGPEQEYIGIVNFCLMALMMLDRGLQAFPDDDAALPSFLRHQEELEAELTRLVDRASDLLAKKNHDYGEAWRDMSISTYPDEILVRVARIKHMLCRNREPRVSEGIGAQFLDMLNYAVLAVIRIREASPSGN